MTGKNRDNDEGTVPMETYRKVLDERARLRFEMWHYRDLYKQEKRMADVAMDLLNLQTEKP